MKQMYIKNNLNKLLIYDQIKFCYGYLILNFYNFQNLL